MDTVRGSASPSSVSEMIVYFIRPTVNGSVTYDEFGATSNVRNFTIAEDLEERTFLQTASICGNCTEAAETGAPIQAEDQNNYWALLATGLVVGTAAGNILVCLAIAWERRLQNVTNYFLMSLAITDLMVAILVMPLGILTLVKGKIFPKLCSSFLFTKLRSVDDIALKVFEANLCSKQPIAKKKSRFTFEKLVVLNVSVRWFKSHGKTSSHSHRTRYERLQMISRS